MLATAASGAAANVAVANIAAGRTGGKGGAGITPPHFVSGCIITVYALTRRNDILLARSDSPWGILGVLSLLMSRC